MGWQVAEALMMQFRISDSFTGSLAKLTRDQTIELTGVKAKNCPIRLRRIGYKDADTGIDYPFLTNHFTLAARTIADMNGT